MPRWTSRALETAGWLLLLPMLGLCLTQWFGIEGRRTIAAFQAVTPWVLLGAVPIAVISCVTCRHPLALAALIPVVTLLTLSYPIVFHGDAPRAAADSPALTIAYSNFLFSNPMADAAVQTLLGTDADVMVMAELATDLHDALIEHAAVNDYPYREESVFGGAGAISVWSRHPIVSGGIVEVAGRPTVDVILDVDGSSIRLLGVHPYPPTYNAAGWSAQLDAIGARAAESTLPTVVVGDFNGSRWHPSFRSLLDRGLTDAHEAMGHGWSVSWPMDEGLLPPEFVRIDHALFGDGLTPTSLRDLEVPGSDHKGFVVTFALTA
ncbi:MAG: endonuclease/exonuclease/phosphatase family protein [Ilumatobacteraceae bacterium]